MKKFLLFVSLIVLIQLQAKTQSTTLFESFNGGTLPAGWDLAQGIKVGPYNNPDNACAADNGLQTPGIGGSNPSKILLPVLTSAGFDTVLTGFKIYIFDANLKCSSKKALPCTTYVTVYLVNASVTTAGVPAASDIYAQSQQQLVISNAINFLSIPTGSNLPAGTLYRVLFDFTVAANCNQPNTKYILDEFSVLQKAKGGLPVKFSLFNAQQGNGKVQLNWQTASEYNNKEFAVQRRMGSGGYQTIAVVPSKALYGNSGLTLNYSYDDLTNLVGAGQVYYRIKQIDLDGHTDFSEIRSIRNNAKKFNITIYPNPGRDLVKVTIPDGAGIVDISLSDMSGKEIKRWNSTTVKNIELANLRPGMYTIRINVKETGEVLVEKILIQ